MDKKNTYTKFVDIGYFAHISGLNDGAATLDQHDFLLSI